MSSQDVIKTTAKKLKYYMDVKRLEDAFDLSGSDKPQRHYPTLKPRPTLLYDGLHDRSLKHYFRSSEVKKHLNNMNPRQSHNERESKVRKDVDNYMAKSKFTSPFSTLVRPRSSPKKRRNTFKGGPILMRGRHGPYLSKGETERLVNAATRLLVASETVPLSNKRSSKHSHSKSVPTYTMPSYELPHIGGSSSSYQLVPHRPDRPKSNYGTRSSSPSRPKSALMARPKSAGGRLKSVKPEPSSKRYGYDQYGQQVRIRKEEPRHFESSESETEDYDDESVENGMTNYLVPVSGNRGQQTPEWLNIQMSKVEVDDGIDSDEEDPREDESNADAASMCKEDPNLYSLDMCTQTGREICTQTVEKPDNTLSTQTRRGDDEQCMTDPYQADMAIQTKVPPTTLSTQTYDPPPTISTQTIPPPPNMSTQTWPEMSTQTTPVDNMETQTEIVTPSVGIQCTPPDPPCEVAIQVEPTVPPPEIGIQCEPPTPPLNMSTQCEPTKTPRGMATQVVAPAEIGIQYEPPPEPTPPPQPNYDYLKHGPKLKSGKRTIYELAINTGDVLGAGTKADVHITLYGERGNTGKIKLRQAPEDDPGKRMKFQKGQIDVFKVESYNVGKLECISIGHNRNDIGCGWYLAKVMVRESGDSITYEFVCERWLSAQDEDGRTVRTLPTTNVIMEVDDVDEDDYVEESPDSSVYSDNDIRIAQTPDGHFVALVPSERGSIASGRIGSIASGRSGKSRKSRRSREPEPESSESESDSEEEADSNTDGGSDSEDDDSGSGSGSSSSGSSSSGSESDSGGSSGSSDSGDDRYPDGNSRGGRSSHSGRYKDRSGGQGDSTEGEATLTDSLSPSSSGQATSSSAQSSHDTDSSSYSSRETAPESKSEITKGRKGGKHVDKDYMAGFKAGIKVNQEDHIQAKEREEEERRKKEEEEERQRQAEERLLQGPSVHESCKTGNLERIKMLVQHNAEHKQTADERGWTPLHIAASRGYLDIVKYLTANEVKLEELTPTGYTPIHMAAMNGHLNVMMVLAAMGSDVSGKTIDEQTALHLAAMSGHTECCKWLVGNRAPLDAIDNMGRTAVDLAEEYQHEDLEIFLRSCKKELTRSDSSLAQLRSRSPSMSSQPADPESRLTDSEGWGQDSKSGDERPSSRAENDEDVADQGPKNKKQLLVRQKSFHEQQTRMNTEGKSFLESIQDEIQQNTEQQA